MATWVGASAQTVITKDQARTMYTTYAPTRVSVHDPSAVWDAQSAQYYIFGTHRGQAKTTDLYHWTMQSPSVPWGIPNGSGGVDIVASTTAFNTPQVKQVNKGGVMVDLPPFNAQYWASQASTNYDINGNLWAPDIIYNKAMGKWCQYLSVNGDNWASSIVMLTADKITGPYVYQAPVVISGFNGTNTNSYKSTDLEIVLGTQASLPSRYAKGSSWGTTWPNCIDPCVFYDANGNLWMTYGSWSGGIFSLQLDEQTGLRDYNVNYPLVGATNNYTSDPYYGKKIAGGYYVSGEGSYVHHVGNYYYLFVTYGGLDSKGGYEMKVFRSQNPDGPFVAPNGTSAVYSSYQMNYGLNGITLGEKIIGAYDDWGFMTVGTKGELSQGHNSVITDAKGRTLLVYHTRFNDGTEGHQVRVHQLFSNQDGWLVAAPFEFTGETLTDADVSTSQRFNAQQVAGSYQVMIHKQKMDYANQEVVRPVAITLNTDGSVSGTYTGTWSLVDGTSYINLTVAGLTYKGVVMEQQMEPTTIKALAFSGMNSAGTCIWGYKMQDPYLLAYTINKYMPVKDGDIIDHSIDLTGFAPDGVQATWTSSNSAVLSPTGDYSAAAMTADTMPTDLTVRLNASIYEFRDTINVKVVRSQSDYWTGAQAYYPFDASPIINAFNTDQTFSPLHNGTATSPQLVTDTERSGKVVHTNFGAAGQESYLQTLNPLLGSVLKDGFTVSFFVKLPTANSWDDLFSFYNASTSKRLYMTGNTYIGYNNGTGNWIDLNYPTNITTNNIPVGHWTLVTFTISRTNGLKLYIDGVERAISYANGSQGGATISSVSAFNFAEVVDHVQSCPTMLLGYGSFWGSTDAYYDDLMVFNRPLSASDVRALSTAETAGHDFTGIETVKTTQPSVIDTNIYNLSGQRVGTSLDGLPRGIYIRQGKKFVVK